MLTLAGRHALPIVFASEEMFPELVNPVQLAVDNRRGASGSPPWPTYPKWEPTQEMNDRLLILPDEDRDGVADRGDHVRVTSTTPQASSFGTAE